MVNKSFYWLISTPMWFRYLMLIVWCILSTITYERWSFKRHFERMSQKREED